jgi:hypothetical protein
LAFFGLPTFIQCDNGLEFNNMEFKQLVNGWDQGECKILHSRARHPQTNGKVEQSNRTVEEMLAAFKIQNNTISWIQFLPKVMYKIDKYTNTKDQS